MPTTARIIRYGEDATELHEERLDCVVRRLGEADAETVLDLGCGSGALLQRLVGDERIRRVVGIDRSVSALVAARARLQLDRRSSPVHVSLRHGSIVDLDPDLTGFHAAVLLETIEHLPPDSLGRVEDGVFARLRPGLVLVTTPNREYNTLLGLGRNERRHSEHAFEWDRPKFERWATGVARRSGYVVTFEGIGPVHALLGSPTQMAVFRRRGA